MFYSYSLRVTHTMKEIIYFSILVYRGGHVDFVTNKINKTLGSDLSNSGTEGMEGWPWVENDVPSKLRCKLLHANLHKTHLYIQSVWSRICCWLSCHWYLWLALCVVSEGCENGLQAADVKDGLFKAERFSLGANLCHSPSCSRIKELLPPGTCTLRQTLWFYTPNL